MAGTRNRRRAGQRSVIHSGFHGRLGSDSISLQKAAVFVLTTTLARKKHPDGKTQIHRHLWPPSIERMDRASADYAQQRQPRLGHDYNDGQGLSIPQYAETRFRFDRPRQLDAQPSQDRIKDMLTREWYADLAEPSWRVPQLVHCSRLNTRAPSSGVCRTYCSSRHN